MRRTLVRLGLAAALAAALLGVAALLTWPRSTTPAVPVAARQPADVLAERIARTQQQLRDVPGDWPTWAALGAAYLERARVTADPAYYPKAEQAAHRSLTLRADGNSDALVVLGALANARHDFPAARGHAEKALTVNDHDAEAYGVLADALTQLGDADGATRAVQRMLDLRPGLSAYARASYDLELHGRVSEAENLMRQALDNAVDPHDVAFCRAQLGDLAFGRGDLATAETEYGIALSADPATGTARHGMARIAAARGDLTGYPGLPPSLSSMVEYALLLKAADRDAEAAAQLDLAAAADRLFTANGGTDRLATAELALAQGRPADAVTAARAEWAVRRHPDVADTLAWALHATGRNAEALPYAQRAVAGGARPAVYSYHLGMIHLGLGQHGAARTELESALATNPHFSPVDVPIARRALAGLPTSGGPR
ncbi:tetratricopeptide repeat protein [Actinoplanes hulinensis]|uniref:tetratricopeptide repeat protein n=1 Tax=Actinoplanes hulinensis TaxID=1144547 RepID=UPI001C67E24A|nr:tetratricopeptide repeat protein [Actinoplanes hulinensis]